jgi:hypothetical protein
LNGDDEESVDVNPNMIVAGDEEDVTDSTPIIP